MLPVALAALAMFAAGSASAQTFREAVTAEADRLCGEGALDANGPEEPGSGCGVFDAPPPGGLSAGIAGFSIPSGSLTIQERLRNAREAEEGGASADQVVDLGQGLSVFASAGVEALNHSNNRYEDGYESTIPSITVGADYSLNKWLVVGAALNYFNFNGNYDDGGDFNTNSYGAILYASILPFKGAFADFTLGYAWKDYFRNRNGVIICECGNLEGNQSGDTNGDEYSAGVLLGYDHPIANFTVGPRVGLNLISTQVDDYREHGSNGLALEYSGQDVTSLQSSVGVLATKVISTQFGVVVPQVDASWFHDYAVGGRTIDASFRDAAAPSEFSFKTEPVAENFANVGIGVAAFLPNGLQPFFSLRTIQGNENFVSYSGTAGVRLGL